MGASDQSAAAALRAVDTAPPRPSIDLATGMTLARAAAKLPQGTERRLLLDKALTALQRGSSGRPFWGEAWTMSAYASSLRDGSDAPQTRSSFALGYRMSPYLVGAAPWRIDFGFTHWESLDPATQMAVIREAVWYSRRGAYERDAVFSRARGNSPRAYRAFMELWINSRVGDAAFVPLKGQTPE